MYQYILPEDVPPATWKAALRHFVERKVPEVTFRRLLEHHPAPGKAAAGPTPVSVDAGVRVAAYLLDEWERYQLARRSTPRRPGGWAGVARRSSGQSGSRDRAAQVALIQRLGVQVNEHRRPVKRRSATPPPALPDAG